MKRFFYAAGLLLLLVFMLCFPSEALNAAREGMNLWLNTLIPTLLPFIILTELLIGTGVVESLLKPLQKFWKKVFGISPAGAYALILGLLCGYPMGAKITSDLYTHHKIRKKEAEYLLTFTSYASPGFLYTYLIHICLNDAVHPAYVFCILILSGFFTMLFFRFVIFRNQLSVSGAPVKQEKKESSAPGFTGTLLDASIMNGFETITRLGGYILLFSILSALFRRCWKGGKITGHLLLGALELTTGLHYLADSGLPMTVRFLCSISLTAFGGICILAQTKSLLNRELSVLPYLSAKCLHAAITAVISLIFIQIV